jgi:hypothetical protein
MVDETTAGIGSLITRRPLGNTFFRIIGRDWPAGG